MSISNNTVNHNITSTSTATSKPKVLITGAGVCGYVGSYVCNVSKAHLEAELRDETNDQRSILCDESHELVKFTRTRPLGAKYGKDYPVRAREMPKLMPMIMRLWNPEMNYVCKRWGKVAVYDGSRALGAKQTYFKISSITMTFLVLWTFWTLSTLIGHE